MDLDPAPPEVGGDEWLRAELDHHEHFFKLSGPYLHEYNLSYAKVEEMQMLPMVMASVGGIMYSDADYVSFAEFCSVSPQTVEAPDGPVKQPVEDIPPDIPEKFPHLFKVVHGKGIGEPDTPRRGKKRPRDDS